MEFALSNPQYDPLYSPLLTAIPTKATHFDAPPTALPAALVPQLVHAFPSLDLQTTQ